MRGQGSLNEGKLVVANEDSNLTNNLAREGCVRLQKEQLLVDCRGSSCSVSVVVWKSGRRLVNLAGQRASWREAKLENDRLVNLVRG